jgi:MFS family permease
VFFKDPHFIFFLLVVFITGCGRQVLQLYLPPHLERWLGMNGRQAGWAVVSSTVFSIVFMFIGGPLIKYLGVNLMLGLGMAVMGVRLCAYMYLTPSSSPFFVYAIELLNGVAFSFTHLAGVKITADFAPPGLEATGQAIYTSSYMQLPAVLVPLIGRKFFYKHGGVVFFGMTGKALLVCAALVGVKYLVQAKLQR